jgi:hypothetical protein
MTRNTSTAAEISQFGPRDIAIVTEQQDEIIIIRATLLLSPEEPVSRATPLLFKDSLPAPQQQEEEEEEEEKKEQKNPFILSASTAPALLETNPRPKWARGPTLDYKAMHEGKQNQPK